jgi:outer membrane protein OmpA-like peptidoglycan-associated protein
MRRRSEDIHVWPALTDLMGGITLVVMVMLVQSMVIMEIDRAHLKQAINDAREALRRESQRIGVKRELLETLRTGLVARHVQVEISPAGNLVIPADFLFALGKDHVDPAAVEPLGRGLRELLLSEKGANVRYVLVIGHTDDVGGPAPNLELSVKRALKLVAVWNRTLFAGSDTGAEALCATKKLIPSGMGQMSPAVVEPSQCGNQPGELVGCRANRRIEIQILPKEADDADPCKARTPSPVPT